MKITTPHGTLKGDNIEAILKEHGYDCLHDADLRYADLRGANLHGACLHDADLRYADLRGANLHGACLGHADLSDANLSDADLSYANLSDADLRGADLSGADLRYADLSHADLSDANHVQLSIAKTSILPDEGDIIGWKKAITLDGAPIIVKLLIPADAQRSNATGRKCRASTARVLDLQDKQGNSLPPDTTAYSSYDPDFTYQKGETVHVEDFDTNRWDECAPGIHFFITRIEAVEY
ncbi:pentapeptide repeat-containing protein [Bifidobacterium adolescentis]|uniref:Pentapeptide repeat protein n=1 Tax=Bifidobacterium adolescentis TaxID=1680 RepID=A0A1X3A218_BIFAD|nr:pentapeptide repeat-containing protein [Bifidobacterium adolescentis]OSH00651.1 pentapeptide repeat protein [Bifidobacterium adolescentis]